MKLVGFIGKLLDRKEENEMLEPSSAMIGNLSLFKVATHSTG